jgi:hypothetical protein
MKRTLVAALLGVATLPATGQVEDFRLEVLCRDAMPVEITITARKAGSRVKLTMENLFAGCEQSIPPERQWRSGS